MSLAKLDNLLEELYNDMIDRKNSSTLEEIYSFYAEDSKLKIETKNLQPKKKLTKKPSWINRILPKKKKIVKEEVDLLFKVQAVANFLCDSDTYLHFKKDQIFYVLKDDKERGIYHVSTCMSLPFSNTTVSGLVPSIFFKKID